MSHETLLVSQGGPVAHIRLSWPDKRNGLAPAFWREFPEAIASLDAPGTVRAMILSGERASFCSGMDVSVFSQDPNFRMAAVRAPPSSRRAGPAARRRRAGGGAVSDDRGDPGRLPWRRARNCRGLRLALRHGRRATADRGDQTSASWPISGLCSVCPGCCRRRSRGRRS